MHVSLTDLVLWCLAVPGIAPDSPRFAPYAAQWAVLDKIARAKAARTFDRTVAAARLDLTPHHIAAAALALLQSEWWPDLALMIDADRQRAALRERHEAAARFVAEARAAQQSREESNRRKRGLHNTGTKKAPHRGPSIPSLPAEPVNVS